MIVSKQGGGEFKCERWCRKRDSVALVVAYYSVSNVSEQAAKLCASLSKISSDESLPLEKFLLMAKSDAPLRARQPLNLWHARKFCILRSSQTANFNPAKCHQFGDMRNVGIPPNEP